jgi:rhodanese-related sulfurtransferase
VDKGIMEQLLEFATKHPMLVMGFVAVLALLVWTELKRKVQGLKELSPMLAVAWINDPKAVIVDVSAVADFNKGHIVNARNISLSRTAEPDAEVLKLKQSKVLVVCKTGQTATQAAVNLKKAGITDLAVLKGGMGQWLSDQYPVTNK